MTTDTMAFSSSSLVVRDRGRGVPFSFEQAIERRSTVELGSDQPKLRAAVESLRDSTFRTQALAFWCATYDLPAAVLGVEHASAERVVAYYDKAELVGTVSLSLAEDGSVLSLFDVREGWPKQMPKLDDAITVSRLCLHPRFRSLPMMKRVCEDVHLFLVANRRSDLILAAPRWLRSKYRFIGFRPTGVFAPIPGIAGEELELMTSCQCLFGSYGLLMFDPIRWNMFLRDITAHLVAAGAVRHSVFERIMASAFVMFAPVAAALFRLSERSRAAKTMATLQRASAR